jgi:hypothetical protein
MKLGVRIRDRSLLPVTIVAATILLYLKRLNHNLWLAQRSNQALHINMPGTIVGAGSRVSYVVHMAVSATSQQRRRGEADSPPNLVKSGMLAFVLLGVCLPLEGIPHCKRRGELAAT